MIETTLPAALDAGMTPTAFWTATITEIRQVLESRERCLKREMQQQAALDYRHAYLVAALFGGKSPSIHEVYPALFEEEKKQDWRIAKERLLRYAEAHNKKMGGGKRDG